MLEKDDQNETSIKTHLEIFNKKIEQNLISKFLYNYLESKYNPSISFLSPLNKENFLLKEDCMIDIDELSQDNETVNFSPSRNTDFLEPSLYIEYKTKYDEEKKRMEIKKEMEERHYRETGIKGNFIK